MDRDVICSVVERWRSATLSHRNTVEFDASETEASPPLAAPPPAATMRQPPTADPTRQGLLKRPLTPWRWAPVRPAGPRAGPVAIAWLALFGTREFAMKSGGNSYEPGC